VHISQLANYRVGRVEDVCNVGDTLKVQVSEIDEQGRINLTHKPFAEPATPEQLAQSASHQFDDTRPRRPSFGGRGGHGNGHGRPPRRSFDR
jgi:polyribonucleotide nucleotidyltransferase